jgi:uncharacterized protein YjiS (DUF1127 family)
MSNLQIFAQNRIPDRASRFPAALALFFARLMSVVKRRREARESRPLPESFNDHMLADIGLRRIRLAPRVDNLLLGDDRMRIIRF